MSVSKVLLLLLLSISLFSCGLMPTTQTAKSNKELATIKVLQNPDIPIMQKTGTQYSISLVYPKEMENDLKYKNLFNEAERELSKIFKIDNLKPDFKVVMSFFENIENHSIQVPVIGLTGVSSYTLLNSTYTTYYSGITGYKNSNFKGYSLGIKFYFAKEVNNKSYIVYDLSTYVYRTSQIDPFADFSFLVKRSFQQFPLENMKSYTLQEVTTTQTSINCLACKNQIDVTYDLIKLN